MKKRYGIDGKKSYKGVKTIYEYVYVLYYAIDQWKLSYNVQTCVQQQRMPRPHTSKKEEAEETPICARHFSQNYLSNLKDIYTFL